MSDKTFPSDAPEASHWPFGRVALFASVCLVTLLVFGYAFENWRGRRAWERCKAELLAKGEQLDWSAYIPKPVPDDQNFVKAPGVEAWFRKGTQNTNGLTPLSESASLDGLYKFSHQRHPGKVVIVEVRFLTGPHQANTSAIPTYSPEEFADLVKRNSLGDIGEVIFLNDPRGGTIAKTKPDRRIKQVNVRLSDGSERPKLEENLKKGPLALEPTAQPDVLRLVHNIARPAEDVLDWFHRFDAAFDELYTACQRPYARFDANSNEPFALEIPNYVGIRTVGQILATRAQAELLMSRPEEAIRELAALIRLVDLLKAGQPTLVEAMIRVAMAGLYINTVENGMVHSLWQKPQWIAIQEQLRSLDLLPEVAYALRGGERAAINFMLETYPRQKLARMFESTKTKNSSTWRSAVGIYVRLCPRGWRYQNQVALSRLHQASLEALDLKSHRVDPAKVDGAGQTVESTLGSRWLYNVLAGVAVPNSAKALRVATKNQTLIGEARIACALERYRQARDEYPDQLQKLTPQFIDTLPFELTTGQPFQYQRQAPDRFRLYSVGWNAKDDGGRAEQEADWVWAGAPAPKPANLARD